MADFCKQCSIDMFATDLEDLANITDEADTARGLFHLCICEGCGEALVDHTGKCVSKNCLCKHGKE